MLNRPPNFFVALVVGWFAIALAGFGAALMGSNSGQIAAALAPIISAFIGGGFVLTAALIAWNSVQKRIDAEEAADRRRFQLAATAELIVFSRSIIEATSNWNLRAHRDPMLAPPFWPTLVKPHVYIALVSRIALLEGWVASSVISFYGQVLDLNELSVEAMRGRPTTGTDVGAIAERFRTMAISLAASLDGLNPDRQFPIVEQDLSSLIAPNGGSVARMEAPPTSLQELLRALGRP